MPQPLSKVKPSGQVFGGPDVLTRRPHLSALIMRVINTWSSNDAALSRMLSSFLSADFNVVAAMFRTLGAEAKRGVLLAAAKETVSADDCLLISAVFSVTKASRSRRNDYAHHIWAECEELPDDLILIDPSVTTKHDAAIREHILNARAGGANTPPRADLSKVFVYREKDILDDVKSADQARHLIELLVAAVSIHSPSAEKRIELLKQPLIQQALQPKTT